MCDPKAHGEGWLRTGISAPLPNTLASSGFAYGKMEGEIWPFWGDLWEKMEPRALRKMARISAGVFLLEIESRGCVCGGGNMGCSELSRA